MTDLHIQPTQKISSLELRANQALELGLIPMPLESDLLLQRIANGGHSGQFLAYAFLSAYRTDKPFMHSLGEITRLDSEAFRLFHQILHIRHIRGWSDQALFEIEKSIKEVMS